MQKASMHASRKRNEAFVKKSTVATHNVTYPNMWILELNGVIATVTRLRFKKFSRCVGDQKDLCAYSHKLHTFVLKSFSLLLF